MPWANQLSLLSRTLLCRITGRPDFRRWSRPESFADEWGVRTDRIAELIPRHARILEFGAGQRRLEPLLDSSCVYFPSDLVDRGPGTLVCNLNRRPLPDLRHLRVDTVVFAGVLEYLPDLEGVVEWLSGQANVCIASYECASDARGWARVREWINRTRSGWVNHYSAQSLVQLFARAGFTLQQQTQWQQAEGPGQIFVFEKATVRKSLENQAPADVQGADLVSVVIPCHNQAQYLGEAIESVLRQKDVGFEIIVVDDGSDDDTTQVAQRYPGVQLMRQPNMGLAAARNTGLRKSSGRYLVFLDADDRLLAGALSCGRAALVASKEAALTAGWFHWIDERGEVVRKEPRRDPPADPYRALLRRNYIWMHAVVMYQRWALDAVGGFDASLGAAEDYDVFLRIARAYPISHHGSVVAEYRKHNHNMSADPALMLHNTLRALRAQRDALRTPQEREAYREGIGNWQSAYGRALAKRAWQSVLVRGCRYDGLRDTSLLLRLAPLTALEAGSRAIARFFNTDGTTRESRERDSIVDSRSPQR